MNYNMIIKSMKNNNNKRNKIYKSLIDKSGKQDIKKKRVGRRIELEGGRLGALPSMMAC